MSRAAIPPACRNCADVDRCAVSVDDDGAVWVMFSRHFSPACPMLAYVRAIGAHQAEVRAAR